MPRGVTDQFLNILDLEHRHAVRTLPAAVGVAAAGQFLAELADEPLFGLVSALFTLSLVLGAAFGVFLARRRTRAWSESLRGHWSSWMRFSVSSTTVREVDLKARGKTPAPPALAGVFWALALLANAALFAALWYEVPGASDAAFAVALADGLLVGAWIGSTFWTWRWTRSVDKALRDLIKDGQIGLWGEA
jgi:hypothetical protein